MGHILLERIILLAAAAAETDAKKKASKSALRKHLLRRITTSIEPGPPRAAGPGTGVMLIRLALNA
jgi:hypothetical protein